MSIPALRIPPRHQPALRAFVALGADAASTAINDLARVRPFEPVAVIEAAAARALPQQPAALVAEFIDASLSLATQTKYHGWSSKAVARGLAASPDLELDTSAREAFAEVFRLLLETPAIRTTARAADLQGDHERLFSDARILTDVRPVFGAQASDPPSGAVLNQMLKIEYYDGDALDAIYLALDRNDLMQLRAVIDRALEKSETLLTKVLPTMNMTHYEADTETDAE